MFSLPRIKRKNRDLIVSDCFGNGIHYCRTGFELKRAMSRSFHHRELSYETLRKDDGLESETAKALHCPGTYYMVDESETRVSKTNRY